MIKYYLIIGLIAALVPASMSSVSAPVSAERGLFTFISYSNENTLTITGNGNSAEMQLKARNENGDTRPAGGFKLTADNVLQIQEGQTVRVTNDEDFTKAITIDVNDNKKRIAVSENGDISFGGYPKGVYVLDVVVDDSVAYESIIVIGKQSEEVVKKTIDKTSEKTFIDIWILIIFEEPIDEDCDNTQGSAGLSFPYDKKSECEYEEYLQCEEDELNGLPETDRCDELDEGFFDDCQGFPNAEECNRYFENPDCYDDPNSEQCTQYCTDNPGATGCPDIYEPEPCYGTYDVATATCIPDAVKPITPTPELTPTPTPTPTPNMLARGGLLPTTPTPIPEALDNPCEAIPEPDIPECKDLPTETPEPTPLPPTPDPLLDFPTEAIEEIPNVPLEDTEEDTEDTETEETEEEESVDNEPQEDEDESEEESSEESNEDTGASE